MITHCRACGRPGAVGPELEYESIYVGGQGEVDAWWCREGYGHQDETLPHCQCGHWLTVRGRCEVCDTWAQVIASVPAPEPPEEGPEGEESEREEPEEDYTEQPPYPITHPASGW